MNRAAKESGFSLVELTVTISIFAIAGLSLFGLFTSLVRSTIIAKRQAVASTLATNQMEYLKSLPYDSLAVAGGSIYNPTPLPASAQKTINGVRYTIATSINYVDDAYDGCASYPTQQLKELYCRNYPPPNGQPVTDQNPQDYKIIHVTVTDKTGAKLAQGDTQVSSRVAETASTTGALFVTVIDSNGNPVAGASVQVNNTTLTPTIAVSDSSDSNGVSIFYGLPPDSGTDYHITVSKSGYSTLTSIVASGTLQPTYPSQKILSQQSSYATMVIKQQGANSLVLEAVTTAGATVPNLKAYVKGGYKKYTSTSNTAYYYDNMTPSDIRPTTDASGLASIQNLVPGDYIYCGDAGATGCTVGSTTYYLAAAVAYSGDNALLPISVPPLDPSAPPATTFSYNSLSFLQKVRLILTTNASFPRVRTLTPSDVSIGGGTAHHFPFTITGANLPCSNNQNACGTTVRFLQNGNTYTANCTGTTGTDLSCWVDVSGAQAGSAQLEIVANGYTLTLPGSPLLGGLDVTP
ncbi:MAG TPA: carboxypeptidase regulatory-like domain-containing protein [Candidatus Saccharimonadales bacterium]|nr:carboxypeptidase regulatory-like domain-containing protein [Candidatus Saccharimonadales bacterium]